MEVGILFRVYHGWQIILNFREVNLVQNFSEKINVTAVSCLNRQSVPNLGYMGKKGIHVAVYWGEGAVEREAITALPSLSSFRFQVVEGEI